MKKINRNDLLPIGTVVEVKYKYFCIIIGYVMKGNKHYITIPYPFSSNDYDYSYDDYKSYEKLLKKYECYNHQVSYGYINQNEITKVIYEGYKNSKFKELTDDMVLHGLINGSENEQNTSEDNNKYSYPNNQSINDDQLVKTYIGTKADKFINGGFSWCAFFFGPMYAIYKKMWFFGIMWFIVLELISIIFEYTLSIIVLLAMNIIISVFFKKIYIRNVKAKVQKIKKENHKRNQSELIKLCGAAGWPKTSILHIICYSIMLFTIISIIAEPLGKDYEEKTNKVGTLNIEIPNEFSPASSNDNNSAYYYGPTCNLKIRLYDNYNHFYNSTEDYLKSSISYTLNDIVSEIESQNINNNIWYTLNVTKTNKKYYYYAIIKNDYIYKIVFETKIDNNSDCLSFHNTIINSMNFE